MAFNATKNMVKQWAMTSVVELCTRAKGMMDKPWGGLRRRFGRLRSATLSIFLAKSSLTCSPYSDITAFQEAWTPPHCCLPPPPTPILSWTAVISQACSLAGSECGALHLNHPHLSGCVLQFRYLKCKSQHSTSNRKSLHLVC